MKLWGDKDQMDWLHELILPLGAVAIIYFFWILAGIIIAVILYNIW